MPIYEYQCQACEYKFDKLQKISDAALLDCPECDKPKLKKLVSAVAFRLKGAGWYETDFKSSDKQKNIAGNKSENKSEKPKTDSKTSDTKTGKSGKSESKSKPVSS